MRVQLLFGGLLCALAYGQEKGTHNNYLSLEPVDLVPYGSSLAWHDIRGISGHERHIYATVGGRFGLNQISEGFVRAVISDEGKALVRQGGTLRFGGVDFEAGIRVRIPRVQNAIGMISVSTPQTPAQKSPILSVGLATTRQLTEKLSFELNPRATLVHKNGLAGLGTGLSLALTETVGVTAEYTWMFMGENTRSIDDGSTIQRNLYGFGVHYATRPGQELSFGWTNATGGTTGFGLTPGLGGSNGFYLSIRGKF